VVIKQEVGNAGMSVDIRSLATGVYFVLLKTPDSIATGKFVK
jgi:hypothetical protein